MLQITYVLEGLGITLQVFLGALVLAILLAVPLTMLRRSRFGAARFIGAIWSWLARGIPPVAWLVIIYSGLSLGIISQFSVLAAIVGLGIINSAYISDSIRAGFDSVPAGQWESSEALAMTPVTTIFRVVLPQAFPIIIASTAAYSITLLKNTAIASIIGANELVFYAYNAVQVGAPALPSFLAVGAVYLIFTVPIGLFVRWAGTRGERAKAA